MPTSRARGGLPLVQVNGSTAVYYFHDQIGSTRVLTNQDGSVNSTYEYTADGAVKNRTGNSDNPFQYVGQYLDSTTGLYYMGARYYDPDTAQLLLHRRMSHDHVIVGIAAALRAGALTVDAVALEARRTAGRVTPGEAGPDTALGPFASPVVLLTARRPAELPPDPGRCLRWPPTTNSCVIPGHRPGVLPDEGAPP